MRHHKHIVGGGGQGVNLGIIVVPMLDMSFQLLSFFIMVYSPNAAEEFIGGELGRTKSVMKDAATKSDTPMIKDPTKIPTKDIDPELEQSFTVVVTTLDPRSKGGAVKFVDSREALEPRFIQIKSPATALDKEAAKDGRNMIDLAGYITSADPKVRKAEKLKAFQQLEENLKSYHREATLSDKDAPPAKGEADDPGAIQTKIRIEADRGIQFDYVIQVFAACKRAGFDEVTFTTPLE